MTILILFYIIVHIVISVVNKHGYIFRRHINCIVKIANGAYDESSIQVAEFFFVDPHELEGYFFQVCFYLKGKVPTPSFRYRRLTFFGVLIYLSSEYLSLSQESTVSIMSLSVETLNDLAFLVCLRRLWYWRNLNDVPIMQKYSLSPLNILL